MVKQGLHPVAVKPVVVQSAVVQPVAMLSFCGAFCQGPAGFGAACCGVSAKVQPDVTATQQDAPWQPHHNRLHHASYRYITTDYTTRDYTTTGYDTTGYAIAASCFTTTGCTTSATL